MSEQTIVAQLVATATMEVIPAKTTTENEESK